jgi:uncharacterized membrane protein
MKLVVLLVLALALVGTLRAVLLLLDQARQLGRDAVSMERDPTLAELPELLVARERVLSALRSTELDLQTGKIAPSDFERTQLQLQREALALMDRMERCRGEEADLERAAEALQQALADARRSRVREAGQPVREWSELALARHGGQAPAVPLHPTPTEAS